MINRNRFLKVFSLTMAAMALTLATNARAEDPTTAEGSLASAENTSDSLTVTASVQSRLAINLKQEGLDDAPAGIERAAASDAVTFSHADAAKRVLPSTAISKIHLVSNDNEGFEVRACSDYGGRLVADIAAGEPADGTQEVPYALSVSTDQGQSVASGELLACGVDAASAPVIGGEDSLLIDGEGIPYENSLVALDDAGLETLDDARVLSISWAEDVSRVADSFSDTIRVKIFAL